ncbi:MAG TPA: DUF2911 domain-containing protein [Bryobacteraceae bacterium]|nr:DUF2911 domain-containing protein [Bryobacteraceae bacterium]
MRLRNLLATALLFATVSAAQLSPRMSTSVTIAGKKITVSYGAPSMRGRKIMGALVPYGEVWCAGANDATELVTEADLDVNGMKVPKGSYTLWTLPNASQWLLIVNKETGVWHTDYDRRYDLGRVKMNIRAVSPPVERMKFELSSAGGNQGALALAWETTEVSVPITVLR